MPHTCTLEQAVDHVLSEIDGPIHLGLPLGLGKPNRWVNALYERVRNLPGVKAWIDAGLAEKDFLQFEEPYRTGR